MQDQTQGSHSRHTVIARTLIFITSGDDVLLLKRASDRKLWPGLYNGVGGHVEPGETVLDSAIRELREETGLSTITHLDLRGIITIETKRDAPDILVFLYTGQTIAKKVIDSAEGTLHWMNWQEVPPEESVEDLPMLLYKIMTTSNTTIHYGRYTFSDTSQLDTHFTSS